MMDFIHQSLTLPTAVYTVMLGFVLAYWSLAIIGLLDIDMVDLDTELGMDLDLDLDLDLDMDLDLDLDGPELDLDGPELDGPEVEAGSTDVGLLATVLSAFGLTKVPITVSVSFIVLLGWVFCSLGMLELPRILGDALPSAVVGAVVGLGSLVLATPLAGVVSRPLAPLFTIHKAKTRRHYIGETATVLTQRVDERFGQGEIHDGGAGLTVQIRTRSGAAVSKGDEVLVISFDDDHEAYIVEPLGTPRAEKLQARIDALRDKRAAAARKSRSRR
jgi:hypothetical protein